MSVIEMITPSKLFHRGAITNDSSQFLIGRRDLIINLANRLAESDVSAVVYGMRGVGKTTIAWQVISLLEGNSSKFRKQDVLLYGKDDEFLTVFHKCQRTAASIGDLLIELIFDNSIDEYSFGSRFSKSLASTKVEESFQQKFGLSLFKTVNFEKNKSYSFSTTSDEAKRLLPDEANKKRFFFDLLAETRRCKPNTRIVMVLDEMDRTPSLEGLGDFIKDTDNLQFLFVGVGETVSSIIADHKSAGRKLSGNDYEAPILLADEIRQIFRNAEAHSDGTLSIDHDFIEDAVRYSGGTPWIAQHIGYEGVFQKQQDAGTTATSVSLIKSDFQQVIRSVMSIYEKDLEIDLQLQSLEQMGPTEYELLQILVDTPAGLSEAELRDALSTQYKRFFDGALHEIEEAKIVVRREQMLSFFDPALRMFVNYELDNH